MKKRMPGLLASVLFGLLAVAACTVVKPSDGTTDPMNGGAGGVAGASHAAGRGGAAAHAGSSGKAGAPSHGGSSSMAGDGDSAGEGGAPPEVQCPNCPSGLCLADQVTCVDCLPAHDVCAGDTVCGSENKCVPGCKADGTSCASGVCADAKNCQSCMGDDECGVGNVCGDNRCAPKCAVAQEGTSDGCSGGHTCCSQHCIDLSTDSQHCGVCGQACGVGQFCGPADCSDTGAAGAEGDAAACVSCHDITIANICSVPQVAVVLDEQAGNQDAGRALAHALAAKCNPAPVVREVSQKVVDALNPASGRPISGAHELLIAAGGGFYARLLVYLDDQHITPIYSYYGIDNGFRKAANDEVVASGPASVGNEDHDFFVIQFMREPRSGSIILNAQGLWISGTNAATYFFEHGMLPDLTSFDKAWYVYEWQDKDGDKAPDLDEITQVASGN